VITLWKVLAMLGLVAMNGFFVSVEFAAVSARAMRLRLAKPTMSSRAAVLIKTRLDLFLSSCQFGNTLAALALGAVTAPAVVSILAPLTALLHMSVTSQHVLAFLLSFAIVVSLQIVIGEQVPKNIAIGHADRILLLLAVPLVIFTYLFYPVIWLLNTATLSVLRGVGISGVAGGRGGLPHTEEELHALLMQAAAQGTITPAKAQLLSNAMEFGRLKVRQIMTPRPEVDFLLLDQPIDQVLRTLQASAYTRLPLCNGDIDHVVGQIHMKDLFNELKLVAGKLKFLDEKDPDGQPIAIPTGLPGSAVHVIGTGQIDLRKIRRDVVFVPEQMPVGRLLRQFQSGHMHLAIVVDEYGSTQGLVTMEDVLEEIVGQIEDEFDPVAPTDLVKDGDAFRISGLFPLHELHDRLDIGPLEADGVDTVGGFIIKQLNRWPKPGDQIALGNYRAKVLTVQQRRVGQVLLEQPKKPPVDPK
jgi:CBS domain containing-hemolysin-like protein